MEGFLCELLIRHKITAADVQNRNLFKYINHTGNGGDGFRNIRGKTGAKHPEPKARHKNYVQYSV